MAKKVIFVGGTSYSGSTMLDLILANDPNGFSCGEIVNLFHPTQQHHVNPACACGDKSCTIWKEAYEAGPKNIHATLFDKFPNLTFVVDSSKNPCWIAQHARTAQSQGLDVLHVLAWKSPSDLALSYAKRGRSDDFISAFCNYHKIYNYLIPDWIGVNYGNFVDSPDDLTNLCKQLDIAMFSEKRNFWTKRHHTLFGNNSAKVSLLTGDNPKFKAIRRQRMRIDGGEPAPLANYRKIYGRKASRVGEPVDHSDPKWVTMEKIACALDARSIGRNANNRNSSHIIASMPKASGLAAVLRCARDTARRSLLRLRYTQRFK